MTITFAALRSLGLRERCGRAALPGEAFVAHQRAQHRHDAPPRRAPQPASGRKRRRRAARWPSPRARPWPPRLCPQRFEIPAGAAPQPLDMEPLLVRAPAGRYKWSRQSCHRYSSRARCRSRDCFCPGRRQRRTTGLATDRAPVSCESPRGPRDFPSSGSECSREPRLATDESQGCVRTIFGGVGGRGPVTERLRAAPVSSVSVEVGRVGILMALFAQQMSSPGLSALS